MAKKTIPAVPAETVEKASERDQNAPEDAGRTNIPPERHADVFRGAYRTEQYLSLRDRAGMESGSVVLAALPKGINVYSEGGYTMAEGVRWLFVQAEVDGVKYDGYCSIRFLAKL